MTDKSSLCETAFNSLFRNVLYKVKHTLKILQPMMQDF